MRSEEGAVKTQRYALIVVMSGMLLTGLIGLLVVGSVVYAALAQGRVPDVLSNWGGIIIGFFVGQFFNFAKAFLEPRSSEGAPLPPN
jgi:uncharacterized membrane protein AbrB (regulator of aidB expression)